MGLDDNMDRAVKRELRHRGFRRFLVRTGFVLGLAAGAIAGGSAPRTADYTDALRKQAGVEQYVSDSILHQYTGPLSFIKGGRENAFLNDASIDSRIKDLYRQHAAAFQELSAEATDIEQGRKPVALSTFQHPVITYNSFKDNFGKASFTHKATYQNTLYGAAIGGALGIGGAVYLTRRRKHR